jgi:hypothetical protein
MRNRKTKLYIPVDLAAVCSVAFILLLLYISMAGYKPEEPVEIKLPETSGYQCTVNSLGDAFVLIGEGKVFLYLPDTVRKDALTQMGNKYNIRFTQTNIDRFASVKFIGMPLAAFGQDDLTGNHAGLSLNERNDELAAWISAANKIYYSLYQRRMMISIKADKNRLPLNKKGNCHFTRSEY